MSTAVENPPVEVVKKENFGVPRVLPANGGSFTIVIAMAMSALCYFLAWAVGKSDTAKIARLWRIRASLAWTAKSLQSEITAAYLNGKIANGAKEVDPDSPSVRKWVMLADEYQSVFMELEVDAMLKNPLGPKRNP